MSVGYKDEVLDGGFHRINLTGNLDTPSTKAIEEQFNAVIALKSGDVIVDLGGIDYISSSGMRMLLVGARTLREQGAELRLAAPNNHVREIIKLVGYDLAFPVHDTIEEALAALGQQ